MKTPTSVKTTITVSIGEQTFDLSLDDAKKLKAQLESAIPRVEPVSFREYRDSLWRNAPCPVPYREPDYPMKAIYTSDPSLKLS